MTWLARLKKSKCAPAQDATKPTEPGFVGFVAPIPEPFQKSGAPAPAANELDTMPTSTVVDEELRSFGSSTRPRARPVRSAVRTETSNPDRWAWPHSDAMNGAEIDTFTARLARFTDKGLSLGDAERLADKLVTRDRDDDDRRLCLECTHLKGTSAWRCESWQRAGVATRAGDAQLPRELVVQLQRCDGLHAVRNCQLALMISENLWR